MVHDSTEQHIWYDHDDDNDDDEIDNGDEQQTIMHRRIIHIDHDNDNDDRITYAYASMHRW